MALHTASTTLRRNTLSLLLNDSSTYKKPAFCRKEIQLTHLTAVIFPALKCPHHKEHKDCAQHHPCCTRVVVSIWVSLKKHVDAGHSKTCMMTALQLSCIKHVFLPDFREASPSMRWELYGLLTPPHSEFSRLKHSLISSGQEASPSKQLEESSEPLIFFHSRPVSCWEGVATSRHAMRYAWWLLRPRGHGLGHTAHAHFCNSAFPSLIWSVLRFHIFVGVATNFDHH